MRPCHSINEQCYEKREAAECSEDAWPIQAHGSVRRARHSSLHWLWFPVSCEVNPQTRWQHDLYIQSCGLKEYLSHCLLKQAHWFTYSPAILMLLFDIWCSPGSEWSKWCGYYIHSRPPHGACSCNYVSVILLYIHHSYQRLNLSNIWFQVESSEER